ncbi:hypothetical protein NRI82_004136 [Vibrio vulnificus]|nr:hypothetical protein [Vibrio vulnificus]
MKQSPKPFLNPYSVSELLTFVNHSRHLTLGQAVKLRLRIARIEYRQQAI